MTQSLLFVRGLFAFMAIVLLTTFTFVRTGELTIEKGIIGIASGLVFAGVLVGLEITCRRFKLKDFNAVILGLFLGILLSQVLQNLLTTVLELAEHPVSSDVLALLKMAIMLSSCYLGVIFIVKTSEQFALCIPFLRFNGASPARKDLLVDSSALQDPRLSELAASGLLDRQLIVPRFLVRELQITVETSEESQKLKARRALDNLKKLEGMGQLELRFADDEPVGATDSFSKLLKLAKNLDAHVLTSDIHKQMALNNDQSKVINLNALANILKPVTYAGEQISIKVQRYGKEARQGIGYLEDGTMVVVNGGSEFLGETIRAQVLSVKHTTSGRMIFCNAMTESMEYEQEIQSVVDAEQPSQAFY